MLTQINHKTEARERVFVNLTHAVINEVAGDQQRQTENAHVVVVIFVKTSDALTVNNKYTYRITVRSQAFQWRSPNPDTLSTRINTRANTKASLSIQEHPVE